MDLIYKTKWLEALRSGKFQQGIRYLKTEKCDNTYYCCLGVLCEIANLENSRKLTSDSLTGDSLKKYNFICKDTISSCVIPYAFKRKIGILDNYEDTLINMNDKKRKSFNEIADWIEKNM